MRPAEPDRVLRFFPVQQTVEEAGGEAVAAADTIVDIQFRCRRLVGLAVDPGHRAPTMAIGRVDFAQRRRHDLHVRMLRSTLSIMPKKALGSSFDFACNLGSGNAEAQLQILFVAHQNIDILDDARDH